MAGSSGDGGAGAESVHRWRSVSPAAGCHRRSTRGAAAPRPAAAPSERAGAAAAAAGAAGGGASTTGTVAYPSGCQATRTPSARSCCRRAGTVTAARSASRLPRRPPTPGSGGSRWNAGVARVASGAGGSGRTAPGRCCCSRCPDRPEPLKGQRSRLVHGSW